jgi:hypothetical protein
MEPVLGASVDDKIRFDELQMMVEKKKILIVKIQW